MTLASDSCYTITYRLQFESIFLFWGGGAGDERQYIAYKI
jgi:hypothetical protein